jgi:hypothetical protein
MGKYMGEFYKNNSCDKSLIDRIEVEIGKPFPLSYKNFLFQSNGGEYINKALELYILFFCCEDIPQYNKDYCVQKYLTENIIGFASGDNGYFFDYREQGEPKIISCSFSDLDITEIRQEAAAFEEFIQKLALTIT